MTRDEVIAKAKAARPELTDEQLGKLADAYLAKKGGAVEVKTETVKVEKPAQKPPPKPAPKAEAKAPPPAATVVRKETVTAAPAPPAPSLPMRTPQPQTVRGGAYSSQGEAMSPDRYQRFVQEAQGTDLTAGLQYLGNRAMGALSRSPPPRTGTSAIMEDEARRPTARSFVTTPEPVTAATAPRAAAYTARQLGMERLEAPPSAGPTRAAEAEAVIAARGKLRAAGYDVDADMPDMDILKAASRLPQ